MSDCWVEDCYMPATTTVRIILLDLDAKVCDDHAKVLGKCEHFPCVCALPSSSSKWCTFHGVRLCLWCGGVLSASLDPHGVGV